MVNQLSNAKPGNYVMAGGGLKSFNLATGEGLTSILGGNSQKQDLQTLATHVAFLNAAIQERQDQIVQTPYKWFKDGKELDQKEQPFGLNQYDFARIERALCIYNRAYYHKSAGKGLGSKQTKSIAWVNPSSIRPFLPTVPDIHVGYTHYQRTTANSALGTENKTTLPAEKLVRFEIPGMADLFSDESLAVSVSSSAVVIRAIDQLQDFMFDKNSGLPIYMITVPEAKIGQVDKLIQRFRKLTSRDSFIGDEHKTIGVPEGVEVQKLSLVPSELELNENRMEAAKTIVSGMGVPLSRIFGAANYATKKGDNQEFALKMAHRLQWIASVINQEPAFVDNGYEMVVEPNKIGLNLEDEEVKFRMLQYMIGAGEDLSNAYQIAGIELPDTYKEPVRSDDGPNRVELDEIEDDPVEEEIKKLTKYYSKGERKRPFKSLILTDEEINLYRGDTYP